jgi:hypothetical protein
LDKGASENIIKENTLSTLNNPVTNQNDKNALARAEFDISHVQQNPEVRFMVQLAASHVPLTKLQLWAICPGNLTIEIMKERKWYMYRITGFRLFSEANRVALESGVESAYVISTLQGKEIPLPEARQMTKVLEAESTKRSRSSNPGQIDYFIQVTASRIQLTGAERDEIYSKYPNCRVVVENGWFKYQSFVGTSYSDAINQKKDLAGKYFIAAYKGGTRINLHK